MATGGGALDLFADLHDTRQISEPTGFGVDLWITAWVNPRSTSVVIRSSVLTMWRPKRINPRSDRPAYKQVADDIRDHITSGAVRPGDPLPGERDLASDEFYDVAVNTIRQALNRLRLEELIVTEKGKGSYVNEPLVPEVVTLPAGATAVIRLATDHETEVLDLPEGALVVAISGAGQSRVLRAFGTIIQGGAG